MNILLFGNKGQIGQEIEKLALTKNIKIIGFDIKDLDITNTSQLDYTFKHNIGADLVINTAAYTNVENAEKEPEKAYQINCQGAQNLGIICRKYNLPLLHLSTDYVFSGKKIGPYTEIDKATPLGVYGKSKLAGDLALEKTWKKHIILRISWVFGVYGSNFVKTIIRLARERDTLNIVGDQFGCPTPAADVARVLLEMAEKIFLGSKKWGIYNYCGYPATSWYEFATKIIELGRTKFPLKVQQINKTTTEESLAQAKRPKNSELLVEKINRDYGILRKNWEDYLIEVINSVTPLN